MDEQPAGYQFSFVGLGSFVLVPPDFNQITYYSPPKLFGSNRHRVIY